MLRTVQAVLLGLLTLDVHARLSLDTALDVLHGKHAVPAPRHWAVRLPVAPCTGRLCGRMHSATLDAQYAHTVRLLTLNLYLRPPPVRTNASDFKDKRLAIFVEDVLPHYDVLALQETFSAWNERVACLLRRAQRRGMAHAVTSPKAKLLGTPIDGGLVILSRYPILSSQYESFAVARSIDR